MLKSDRPLSCRGVSAAKFRDPARREIAVGPEGTAICYPCVVLAGWTKRIDRGGIPERITLTVVETSILVAEHRGES